MLNTGTSRTGVTGKLKECGVGLSKQMWLAHEAAYCILPEYERAVPDI